MDGWKRRWINGWMDCMTWTIFYRCIKVKLQRCHKVVSDSPRVGAEAVFVCLGCLCVCVVWCVCVCVCCGVLVCVVCWGVVLCVCVCLFVCVCVCEVGGGIHP